MKKTIISGLSLALVLLASAGTASAQDDDMLVIPVEIYACKYNDGKGPTDLDAVVDKWNAWADKQKEQSYAAWTLTPFYFGQEQDFDVIWLGAGKDGAALGRAQDNYLANDEGLVEAFTGVISCRAHTSMASINHKAPPKGATPKDSFMTFSDCSYKDGASFRGLNTAMDEWEGHLKAAGSKAGIWHWYPWNGGGDEDFDFKWIEAHASLADMGGDFDDYGNGRGFETAGKLFGHMIDCDSNRVYVAKSRRHVQLR